MRRKMLRLYLLIAIFPIINIRRTLVIYLMQNRTSEKFPMFNPTLRNIVELCGEREELGKDARSETLPTI